MDKGWSTRLSTNIVNLLDPVNFITQLQTMFEEINLKQKAEGKLLYLKQTNNVPSYITIFVSLKVQCAQRGKAYATQFYNRLKDLIKDKIS